MRRETGPTYSRLSCCNWNSCQRFDSMLAVGECYEEGGRAVRDCSECRSSSKEYSSTSK